jgi:Ser/Thr protein kinase RdoA (MazF antagonist)
MQCGTAFPAELLNQLKLQAMKDLREAPPPPVAPMPQLNAKLLVVLSIVCWPMALIYYVRQTRVR